MEVRSYYQRPDGRICFLEDLVPAAGNEIRFRWRLCRPRSGWRGDGDMGLLVNPMQETEDTFCLRPVDCRGWKWLHTGCDSCRYRRRVSVGTIYMARGLPMTEASNDGWYNRCILGMSWAWEKAEGYLSAAVFARQTLPSRYRIFLPRTGRMRWKGYAENYS